MFEGIGGVILLLAIISSIVGTVLVFWVIVNMPVDHFTQPIRVSTHRNPVMRVVSAVVRNAIGAVLIVLGIYMVIAPGPGILAILLGISIMDLPGKHRLIDGVIQRKSVRTSLNWVRKKFNKPPLEFPDPQQ
ncbi:PGPGW domain-containing protein [Planctomicrobium sp. SH668]|uniref:PGPGW domain-containing protein n=1 Tax=Planctomicrobium sp. SH668 TaxID=3448126 RepID=UPI003F5B02A9